MFTDKRRIQGFKTFPSVKNLFKLYIIWKSRTTNLIQHPMKLFKKCLPRVWADLFPNNRMPVASVTGPLENASEVFSCHLSPQLLQELVFSRLTVLVLAKTLKGAEMKSFLLYLLWAEAWKNKSGILKPQWSSSAGQINSGHEVHRCRPSWFWTWPRGQAVLVVTVVNCHLKDEEQTLRLWLWLWLL